MAISPSPTVTKMFYGTYEFVPVPLVGWSTALVKDATDESLFLETTLELNGTLCDFASESGAFTELMAKRQELEDAVTTSGLEFKITHEGDLVTGASGIFPTLESVSFEPGTWTDQIPYSITFTFNQAIEGKPPVQNFTENWAFQENEDRRSVSVTHDISAQGINTGVSGANNALQNAREFVLSKTGYGNVPANHPAFVQASGLLPSGLDLVAFEGLRTESVDVQGGGFQVTEQFVLSSGAFTHDQTAQFQTDAEGVTIVNVDGTIQGLGRGDICFTRALDAYRNLIEPRLAAQAQSVYSRFGGSGTLFVSRPEGNSATQNEFLGTIGYNRSYTDNPASDLPPDIQDASIAISNTEPTELFVTIPICNRSEGPIVQDVATTTPGQYSLNGSVTAKAGVDVSAAAAYAQTLINQNLPTAAVLGHTPQTIFLSTKNITKDPLRRQVSFNLQWQYTSSTRAQDGPQSISC